MQLDSYTKRLLRLWMPALIIIILLVLTAIWGNGTMRFFLLTHHWLYFISVIVLFNPIVQTFWPPSEIKLKRQYARQRAKHARQQATHRKGEHV